MNHELSFKNPINSLATVSFYNSKSQLQAEDYTGPDYAQPVLLLPGQGVDFNLWQSWPWYESKEACQVLRSAQEKSQNTNSLFVKLQLGSAETFQLEVSPNAPSTALILTFEVALYHWLKAKGLCFSGLIGHSFGEYAAWVIAGVMDFIDMLDVVYLRDRACQDSSLSRGGLIAVHIAENRKREIFNFLQNKTHVFIANTNSPNQVAVAVSEAEKTAFLKELKKQKIAARSLNMAYPYHSPLLKESKNLFLKSLKAKEFSLNPLSLDLFCSVNRRLYKAGEKIEPDQLRQILSDQLIEPTDFCQSILCFKDSGAYAFFDLDLNETYKNFATEILQPKQSHNETSFSLQSLTYFKKSKKIKNLNSKMEELKKSPAYQALSKAISEVTGYEIADIQITDQFQEDLRIDSIKKAEIVFNTLKDTQIDESISLAKLKTIGEVVEFIEKIKNHEASPGKENQPARFVLWELNTNSQGGFWLRSNYQNESHCTLNLTWLFQEPLNTERTLELINEYKRGPEFKKLISGQHQSSRLVFQINEENLTTLPIHKMPSKIYAVLAFLFELEKEGLNLSAFREFVYFPAKPWLGLSMVSFLASLAKELKKPFLAPLLSPSPLLGSLLPSQSSLDSMRGNEKNDRSISTMPFVVMIGGHRGLGHALAEGLKNKSRLLIIGRTREILLQDNLNTLRQAGFIEVRYQELDAADETAFFTFFNSFIKEQPAGISLFIHSAGYEVSKPYREHTAEEVQSIWQAKLSVLANIQNWIAAKTQLSMQPKVIAFSSVAGAFGNEGQSVYAFTNAEILKTPGIYSIAWPPLMNLGMTESVGVRNSLLSRGVDLLEKEEAQNIFNFILEKIQNDEYTSNSFLIASAKDLFLYSYPFLDHQNLEKTLGKIERLRPLRFAKTLTYKESLTLYDHHINSVPVYPASFILAQNLLGQSLIFHDKLSLARFIIENVLLLPEQKKLKAEDFTIFKQNWLEQKSDHSLAGASFTLETIASAKHYRCEFSFLKANQPEYKIAPNKPWQEIDLSQIYTPDCIEFGENFCVLKNAFSDQTEIYSQLYNKTLVPDNQGLNALALVIEGCMQTASLLFLEKRSVIGIPLSAESVYFNQAYFVQNDIPTQSLTIWAQVESLAIDGEAASFKVQVQDLGQVILAFERIVLSPIRYFQKSPVRYSNKEQKGMA